jgi:hypothetical protein
VASALNAITSRRSLLHDHSAQSNQKAAGANVKTPATEIKLKARSGSETAASASGHRFHEIREIARAATSHPAATHLDVPQSQLTVGELLDNEQPHGLDAIT